MLGDSITEGYGLSVEQAYPFLVEQLLKKEGYHIRTINAGVSGATTANGLSRLHWVLKARPDYLFIALGANDGLRGLDLEVTKKNLREMIQKAKKEKVAVFLAGMKMPPNYGPEFTKKFAKMYKDLAKEESVPLFPFLLEDVAARKKLNLSDGIHPNEEGQKIIAKNVVRFLKKHISHAQY